MTDRAPNLFARAVELDGTFDGEGISTDDAIAAAQTIERTIEFIIYLSWSLKEILIDPRATCSSIRCI